LPIIKKKIREDKKQPSEFKKKIKKVKIVTEMKKESMVGRKKHKRLHTLELIRSFSNQSLRAVLIMSSLRHADPL